MRVRLLILASSVLALGASIPKPAKADAPACKDSCTNSTGCTTEGCIICFHNSDGTAACG